MKVIGKRLFDELTAKAIQAPRKRTHHNLHESLDEDVHRLCITTEPDTYIRPHRHAQKGKWELIVILQGAAEFLVFDDDGTLRERVELVAGGEFLAVETPDNTFHGFISKTRGTTVLEVKKGPYVPVAEVDFGYWAPPEGSEKVPAFLEWLRTAQIGQKPTR